MCGIIGYSPISPTNEASAAFARLFEQSRVRGHHAYGIAHSFTLPQHTLVAAFRTFDPSKISPRFHSAVPTIVHARYSQSGDWRVLDNNQPLVVGDMALAMNGVIHMGTKAEYEAAFNVKCIVDNDSEIFLQKLASTKDRIGAAERFITGLEGSFAAVWLDDGLLFMGRNSRRPLWWCHAFGANWVASTKDIFKRAGFPEPTAVLEGVSVV